MASSSEVMLEEMRHAFDVMYSSAKKYASKTFTVFGAELALLLFYLANDEINAIKDLFSNFESAWFLIAILALLALLVAAVLFIISMSLDARWRFPPDPVKLLEQGAYNVLDPEELRVELIKEYDHDINYCINKIMLMKKLTDIGVYFLVAGALCLLMIKIFGV